MKKTLTTLLLILLTLPVFAQDSTAINTEVLLVSKTTWDGALLKAYPEGQPEITISKITIQPGAQLPVHTHPNPLGGVILEGKLTVYKEDGTSHTFEAGDPILEVVNTRHFGKNTGEVPAVLIAFYVGVEGIPLTVIE